MDQLISQMRLCNLLVFLVFFISLNGIAQPHPNSCITGLWTGTFYNDSTGEYSDYEIAISIEKGKLMGWSHTSFAAGGKKYYGLKKLSVRQTNEGKIIILDAGMLANDYPKGYQYIRQLNVLTLTVTDSVSSLQGAFETERTKEYLSLTGVVNLRKKTAHAQLAIWPYLKTLGEEKKFSFMAVSF